MTPGAAATGAAERPPGLSSSRPVGGPAWRELFGKKPQGNRRMAQKVPGTALPSTGDRRAQAALLVVPISRPSSRIPRSPDSRPGIHGGLNAPGFLGRSGLPHRVPQPLTFLPSDDLFHHQPQKCQQDEAQGGGDQNVKSLAFHSGHRAAVERSERGRRGRGEEEFSKGEVSGSLLSGDFLEMAHCVLC